MPNGWPGAGAEAKTETLSLPADAAVAEATVGPTARSPPIAATLRTLNRMPSWPLIASLLASGEGGMASLPIRGRRVANPRIDRTEVVWLWIRGLRVRILPRQPTSPPARASPPERQARTASLPRDRRAPSG